MTEKTIVLPPNPGGNGADANYRLTVLVPKRRYLSYLRERWWVVMVGLALSLGGVIAYETVRPEKTSSFAGIGGTFNYSSQDHAGLGKDAFVLVEIKNKDWVIVK